MRRLQRKLKVWLQCVWFLGMTPRQLRLRYAELCLAVQSEPVEVDSDLFLHGDQCTHVMLLQSRDDSDNLYPRVAMNAATYTSRLGKTTLKGISIQEATPEGTVWTPVFRTDPPIFRGGDWVYLLRRAIRADLHPYVPPMPLTPLKEMR